MFRLIFNTAKLALILIGFATLGVLIYRYLNDPKIPKLSSQNTKVWVHPALQYEYANWVKEMITNGVELDSRLIGSKVTNIDITDRLYFHPGAIGIYHHGDGKIEICEEAFRRQDTLALRWTLWHELGHGVLMQDHLECDCDIMSANLGTVTLDRWETARARYIKDAKKIIKDRKLKEGDGRF